MMKRDKRKEKSCELDIIDFRCRCFQIPSRFVGRSLGCREIAECQLARYSRPPPFLMTHTCVTNSESWVREAQRVAKHDETVFWKGFRKSICNLLLGWGIFELNVSIRDSFSNVMPLNVNMLSPGIELWVFGHCNCPLIITVEDSYLKVSMFILGQKFAQQPS